jgi:hypothetical protein
MIKHKLIFEKVKELYWYEYKQWDGWLYPKNYFLFNKNEKSFFIEVIPKNKKYLQTIFIKFNNYEFCNEWKDESINIVNTLRESYKNELNWTKSIAFYSEWITNEVLS